jgi:hypothetical protein
MNIFRFSIIAAAAFVLALTACSQTNDLTTPPALEPQFGTPEGEDVYGLAPSSSGVYLVGLTHGDLHRRSLGLTDAYLRKYDRTGRLLWGRQFGTRGYDSASGVAVDSADNSYVVGSTRGSLAGSQGASDAFIRKYSPRGGVLWTRQFGTSRDDGAGKVAVSSSGVYVMGSTSGPLVRPVQGSIDAYIRKYTLRGALVWTRQVGGTRSDYITSIAVDAQGYAYVGGTFSGEYDADMFIRKYSPTGNVAWAKVVDYPLHDEAFGGEGYTAKLAVSGSSLYVGVDHMYSVDDGIEWYDRKKNLRVLKYNTLGTQLWDKQLGEGLNVYTDLLDLAADSSGVVFGGPALNDFVGPDYNGYVYKLDPNGSELWLKAISSSEFDTPAAVGVRPGGEVYVAGYYVKETRPDGSYDIDAFVRRLNSTTGATTWTAR